MSSAPDTLPSDWKWLPLGDLITVAQYGLSTKANSNAGVPLLRMTNQESGRITARDLKYVELNENDKAKFKVEVGDILFNRTNSFELVGRTAMFDLPGDFVFASYLIRIRTKRDKLLPEFLTLYFTGDATQRRLKSIATRAVSQSNISATRLKGFPIPLPPLPDQKKIAQILSTVQRAIEAQERIIQTTAELKKALMHKLFTEGLPRRSLGEGGPPRHEPQKQTEIGPVPVSWQVVRCEDVCDTISVGIVVKPSSYYVKEGVPAFRSQNVREDRIQPEPMVYISEEANHGPVRKSKLSAGDVLIVRTGYPGTSCVVPPEFHGSNCIDLIFVRPKKEKLRSHYLSRFFNSDAAKVQVQAGKIGLAQQHFNVGAVKNTLVPLPPIDQQDEIVSHLELMDSKHDLATSKRNLLQDLFRTLLHELMTAKTRVHELELTA